MTAQYSLSANKGIRRYIIFFLALLFISAYYIDHSGISYLPARLSSGTANQRGSFSAIDKWRKDSSRKKNSEALWKEMTTCLQEGKPTVGPPHHGQVSEAWLNDHTKPNYLIEMSTEDVNAMRTSHAKYQQCSKDLTLESAYLPGSRGIVSTAGGKYIPVFLVSLRLLRKSGSNLPVEVFLANEAEYEPYFCEKVLPPLNARCRILSKELGAASANFTLESYQFKIFSILLSSFEDVLFLDADNLVLNDPSSYFDSSMYRGYGMILWPDFWNETVSPLFYSIQGKRKPTSSSQGSRTCETGQILISKRKAGDTLLLAALYNVYGPKYYYPLLSQGMSGEGDKETFAAAAIYLDKPYYLVEKGVAPLGFFEKEGDHNFRGQAMLQFDPIDDFNRVYEDDIRPAFIHSNFPKFDPYKILDQGVTNYNDKEAHRIWYDFENKHHVISWGRGDPEAQVWKEMIYIACQIGDKLNYHGAKDVPHCNNLKAHYSAVFGQTISR